MVYNPGQTSKSKLKVIFVHCICILLDLCRKSEDSPMSRKCDCGWLLHYFSCSVAILNMLIVSETIVTRQNVFLESESKAA